MDIGRSIKEARKKLKMSQENLAKDTGLTQAYISKIERNQGSPGVDVIKNIAESLGMPMAILAWTATDIEDIEDSKKEMFSTLANSIDDLIEMTFFEG